MRFRTGLALKAVLAVVCTLAVTAGASAQTTTATISGRVLDSQGLAVPGATVTATSPNLQGVREVVTSGCGLSLTRVDQFNSTGGECGGSML